MTDPFARRNRELADRIPASAVRIADAAERQAAALEGLLALLTARLPAAAPAAAPDPVPTPASDEFVDYCARFYPDAHALLVAPPAADPGDEDDSEAVKTRRPYTHWPKYDPRSRELARLATAAEHRMKAAKTAETRAAAKAEVLAYRGESKARQRRLRQWLDAGKGFIDGDAMYYLDADGARVKFVPSSSPHFFLPY